MQLALTEVKLNDNFKPVLSAQPRALTDKEAHKKTLVVSMAAKAVKAGKYFDNTLLLSLNSKLLELQGQCDNIKKRKVHKSTQSNGKKRKVADNKNTRCSNDGRVIKATHSFVTKSEVKPVISDDQFRPRLFLSL